MRAYQRYSLIGVLLFVAGFLILEEHQIGKGYIYLSNQYTHEVTRNITVARKEKRESIGIVIVLDSVEDEDKYQMALDTVRCYGRHFEYDVHVLYGENESKSKKICTQKDFMFRRHCILSLKMPSLSNNWLLFLDGDMGVINPNHLIEDYIPDKDDIQIVFYNRIMNHEIMAGSYLVRNSDWSRKFLMFWATFESNLPKSFHGSDNGAIHSVIINQDLPKLKSKLDFCENEFWKKSSDYESLSIYEVCAQEVIKNNPIPQIKILQKGRYAWARDGWLTNSVWSDTDFIFHGWQKKRQDTKIFAMWHSPLVYNDRWNLTKCTKGEAWQNWKYKDTFMGNIIDVDRTIFKTIQDQEKSYKHNLGLVLSH